MDLFPPTENLTRFNLRPHAHPLAERRARMEEAWRALAHFYRGNLDHPKGGYVYYRWLQLGDWIRTH